MRHLRAALFGAAVLLLLTASGIGGSHGSMLGPPVARAASPEPSVGSGDTRSAGEAPGFVGSPLLAVAAVLALGAVAAIATIGYVRLTGGPGRGDDPRRPTSR